MNPRYSAALTLAGLATLLVPHSASACGGCFAPTGTVSVVNAHRMAFLSSPSGSMLWDQIQYTGDPADFVWVLPVAGTPTIEVGDNGFFEALTQVTQITMRAPPRPRTSCGPSSCGYYGGVGYSDAGAAAADTGSPVHVFHEGVVGPYETATIGSTDAMALVDWLHAHGYVVSDALLPTIAYYVDAGMNFVALRLAPTAGIDRMTPVRVQIPGLALTLPLRMVAAGVGSEVELELFVFSEARMEAANFGNAEVDRAAITYDWSTGTFDYDARFDDALFRGTGVSNNWVTEFAQAAPLSTLASWRSGSGPDVHSGLADTQIVSDALPNAYLTRLRTRLPPSQLDVDLTLRLANSGESLGTFINVTRELHRAPDVVCPPAPVCYGPGGAPIASGGGGCVVGTSSGTLAPIAMAIALLAIARRRRRARS